MLPKTERIEKKYSIVTAYYEELFGLVNASSNIST